MIKFVLPDEADRDAVRALSVCFASAMRITSPPKR